MKRRAFPKSAALGAAMLAGNTLLPRGGTGNPRARWPVAAVLLVFAMTLSTLAGATAPALANDGLALAFHPEDGRLVRLLHVARGHEHIDATEAAPLWRLAFADGDGIAADAPGQFSWEATQNTVHLRWALAEPAGLVVAVRLSLTGEDAESTWQIAVDGLGDRALTAVDFPRVGGVVAQEHETLAVPIWGGERTREARRILHSVPDGQWSWEHPGFMSLQAMALYGEAGPGASLSSRDAESRQKRYFVHAHGEQGLLLGLSHIPARDETAGGSYALPYPVVVGAFDGDWFTVAERYRAWALEQPFAQAARAKTGRIPAWLRETGLWVWNRGHSPGVLGPAAVLQAELGLPVSVFWHWWHGCAYDHNFPEYLPPREGADAFRDALRAADDAGLHAVVYMNQRLWCMGSARWERENAARFAVKNADGNYWQEVYNTFMGTPCVPMCIGTAFWRDTYAGLVEEAVTDLGVHGIYMDQACLSLPCYDESHGHPIGGGNWWIQANALLTEDIRARTASTRTVLLAGEGCGESWLPHLDAMLALQVSMERYKAPGQWEAIPFFHAVYAPIATLYGNYSSLTRPPYDALWPAEFAPEHPLALLDRKFGTQFRLEQARAFAWGQQPTVANFQPSHLEERAEEMAFAMQLALLRRSARAYLQEGTMLRAPRIPLERVAIPMSRLSIYAGQQDAVQEFTHAVDPVIASAWQAPDGSIGIVLVNIRDAAQSFSLRLEPANYPLPPDGTIVRMDAQGSVVAGAVEKGAVALGLTLAPFDAAVYTVGAELHGAGTGIDP